MGIVAPQGAPRNLKSSGTIGYLYAQIPYGASLRHKEGKNTSCASQFHA